MSTTAPSPDTVDPAAPATPATPASQGAPATTGAPRGGHRRPAAAVILGLPIALAAVVALVFVAFSLPAVKASPHDVPLGLAGPTQATQQVAGALAAREPGAFVVTTYATEGELESAIRDRDVYGGIAMGPSGPTVLTASAASPAVATALTQLGTGLAQQSGTTPAVRDVVPLPEDDPRGAGLGAVMLPLVIGAILPAVAITRLARRRGVQLAAVTTYAVVAGLSFAAILHFGYGTLSGDYLMEAGVLAATVGASALALVGLVNALGVAGLGLGAATLVLLGNPLSGATSAPEFLASPWREIGQAMPPGAGSQLLRSVTFFDGAASTMPWLVLAAWAFAGAVLLAIPRRAD